MYQFWISKISTWNRHKWLKWVQKVWRESMRKQYPFLQHFLQQSLDLLCHTKDIPDTANSVCNWFIYLSDLLYHPVTINKNGEGEILSDTKWTVVTQHDAIGWDFDDISPNFSPNKKLKSMQQHGSTWINQSRWTSPHSCFESSWKHPEPNKDREGRTFVCPPVTLCELDWTGNIQNSSIYQQQYQQHIKNNI